MDAPRQVRKVGLAVLVAAAGVTSACSRPPCHEVAAPAAPLATQDGGSAAAADDFVNGIGVNLHLSFGDTRYSDFTGTVKPRLLDLGVRHVRDGVMTGPGVDWNSDPFYQKVRDLGDAGVGFDLIVFQQRVNAPASDLTQLASVATTWSGNAVEVFEGSNEPDNPGVNGGQVVVGWPGSTVTFTQNLYQAVKAIPTASPPLVAAPSASPSAFASLGDLSAWVDLGNEHCYAGDLNPGSTAAWNGGVDQCLDPARAAAPSKPLFITETGYSTATNAHRAFQFPVTEDTQAKYILRMFGELWIHGVRRSYLYELLDDNPDSSLSNMEWHYGLVRADGTLKPAFASVKNLIQLLADPGPSFTVKDLPFTLAAPQTVQSTLLEKRDGTYWLLIWNEISSYNPSTWCDVPDSPANATLTFQAPLRGYSVYVPSGGTAAVSTSTQAANVVTLSISDDVTLVELQP